MLTGKQVSNGDVARASVSSAEVEQTAKQEGMTVKEVTEMLEARGITVG